MTTFSIVNELNLADKRALIVELKDAIRVDMMAARVAKAKNKEIKNLLNLMLQQVFEKF